MTVPINEKQKEALGKASARITTGVYHQACRDTLGHLFPNLSGPAIASRISGRYPDYKLTEELKQALEQKYRELVCQMSAKKLKTVLYAHSQGVFLRKQVTIDAILTELLERELESETQV